MKTEVQQREDSTELAKEAKPSDTNSPSSLSSVLRFLERSEQIRARTQRELERALEELDLILSSLFAEEASLPTQDDWEKKRTSLREHYLEIPLKRFKRSSPPRRVLVALGNYNQFLLEGADRLPDQVEDSLLNMAQQLGLNGHKSKKEIRYFVRAPVYNLAAKQAKLRTEVENSIIFQAALALDVILCTWRAAALGEWENLQQQKLRWEKLKQEVSRSLEAWADLTKKQTESLPALIVKQVSRRPVKQKQYGRGSHEHHNSQIRSLEGELHLANSIESCWHQTLAELRSIEDEFDQERARITEEMDAIAGWLKDLLADKKNSGNTVPPARVRVLTLFNRKADLQQKLLSCSELLPLNLSVVGHLRVAPKSAVAWNQLYPQETYQYSLGLVRPSLDGALEARVTENHQLFQGCDRVRDVIHFGLDLDGEDGVAEEALENALALLEHQLEEAASGDRKLLPTAERSLLELFTDLIRSLDRSSSRARWYRVKRRFQYEGRNLVKGTGSAADRLSFRLYALAAQQSQAFLSKIGFTRADVTESTIDVRSYLPAEFVHSEDKVLPAVYRRLFRIEPVEDARFLVGRNKELQAFEDALAIWNENRPVSIVLTGQRGSGKTSLLNCLNEQFKAFPITRTVFRERLTTAEALDAFLLELLQLDKEEELVPQLLAGARRIVVIEEMERVFLRKIGGYGALRRLQTIIQATSRQILWIFAANEVCYSFLCRAVSIPQSFTHRMKTAVAHRDDLRSAIMVRHELSGLRLRFSSRYERPNRWRELRQKLTNAQKPESVFFDRLASQSRGVYRTALEVWLGHIEACEGGILYIRQIAELDLDDIVAELDANDLFSLVAILQHGSLTIEEHAEVFALSLEASAGQIEELISRELLEDDPVHIGIRIRPEALPVVKEALFRRNLL